MKSLDEIRPLGVRPRLHDGEPDGCNSSRFKCVWVGARSWTMRPDSSGSGHPPTPTPSGVQHDALPSEARRRSGRMAAPTGGGDLLRSSTSAVGCRGCRRHTPSPACRCSVLYSYAWSEETSAGSASRATTRGLAPASELPTIRARIAPSCAKPRQPTNPAHLPHVFLLRFSLSGHYIQSIGIPAEGATDACQQRFSNAVASESIVCVYSQCLRRRLSGVSGITRCSR